MMTHWVAGGYSAYRSRLCQTPRPSTYPLVPSRRKARTSDGDGPWSPSPGSAGATAITAGEPPIGRNVCVTLKWRSSLLNDNPRYGVLRSQDHLGPPLLTHTLPSSVLS